MNTFFLIGFMGCGKSHWGRVWAAAYNLSFYETDALMETATGKTIAAIFEAEGEAYFRQKEKETLELLSVNKNCIISTGGGTPCFNNNMHMMNECGTTIYLKASPQLLTERLLGEKAKRPLIRNVADDNLETFIAAKLAERTPFYEQAKLVLDAATANAASLQLLIDGYKKA
jgi:shikimate kinase